MTQHAKLSASGSERWLNCPGSVQAEENYPPGKSSPFAMEGSMAHELADLCLKNNKDALYYVGQTVYKKRVEKDMAVHVQEYLDYVRSFETSTTELCTEERVDFSHVVPGGFGTLDSAVIDYDNKTCHIFDLKYGKGVKVDAYLNTQAQLYALGIGNELSFLGEINTFVLHIVQPRIYNFSNWMTTSEELDKFAKYAKSQAKIALSHANYRHAGEKQCQWCRAKGDCGVLAEWTEMVITKEFDNLETLKAPDDLTDMEKRIILENKKLIEMFLKGVEASVFSQLEHGEKFEGYKLVEGRSIRRWNDKAEAKLIQRLGSDAYSRKLIGIGEAEKRLGKEDISKLTIKPSGKTALAPESDKREAINTDLFENIEK